MQVSFGALRGRAERPSSVTAVKAMFNVRSLRSGPVKGNDIKHKRKLRN